MKHGNRHDRRLLTYLDGELGQVEASQVAGHLADCVRCQEKIGRFHGDLERIQGIFDSPPGPGVVPSLEQIRSRAHRLQARKTTVRMGAVGATCAIAVVALWSSSRPAPRAFQTTPPSDEARFADLDAEIDALEIEIAQLQKDARVTARVSPPIYDEEIAAILVQAGKTLDQEFGLTDEARKRYRLAADVYGGSVAGAEAKILLAKMETR